MKAWTPDTLFAVAYCIAAANGVAVLLRSKHAVSIRSILSAMLNYGAAGCGLGMIGYEFLGGAEHPHRVLGFAMLVGIRAVRIEDVREFAIRLLGGSWVPGNRDKDDAGDP